jgi:hypothetical protein
MGGFWKFLEKKPNFFLFGAPGGGIRIPPPGNNGAGVFPLFFFFPDFERTFISNRRGDFGNKIFVLLSGKTWGSEPHSSSITSIESKKSLLSWALIGNIKNTIMKIGKDKCFHELNLDQIYPHSLLYSKH